ncbi:AraC-like DNA-binding protein [Rhizobium etli]|uniref:AraC-like DNA-binding protein n=1 Tax=Rhizobium etli TaxID=29449 RepID=A0A7W6Y509_RHIET|nr:AraC-like DNA-binding protein [Rhizobium etli]MBB4533818.1 AraC-like DNA-binding protein [Rhizobium etli]
MKLTAPACPTTCHLIGKQRRGVTRPSRIRNALSHAIIGLSGDSAWHRKNETPAAESGCSPSSLPHRLDISERQLRRRCHQHFGYGAKTLERIRRFQRFLDLCRRSHAMPLAHLALEAGFADQAHMTREVGELSCLTPAVICDQLNARELPG